MPPSVPIVLTPPLPPPLLVVVAPQWAENWRRWWGWRWRGWGGGGGGGGGGKAAATAVDSGGGGGASSGRVRTLSQLDVLAGMAVKRTRRVESYAEPPAIVEGGSDVEGFEDVEGSQDSDSEHSSCVLVVDSSWIHATPSRQATGRGGGGRCQVEASGKVRDPLKAAIRAFLRAERTVEKEVSEEGGSRATHLDAQRAIIEQLNAVQPGAVHSYNHQVDVLNSVNLEHFATMWNHLATNPGHRKKVEAARRNLSSITSGDTVENILADAEADADVGDLTLMANCTAAVDSLVAALDAGRATWESARLATPTLCPSRQGVNAMPLGSHGRMSSNIETTSAHSSNAMPPPALCRSLTPISHPSDTPISHAHTQLAERLPCSRACSQCIYSARIPPGSTKTRASPC